MSQKNINCFLSDDILMMILCDNLGEYTGLLRMVCKRWKSIIERRFHQDKDKITYLNPDILLYTPEGGDLPRFITSKYIRPQVYYDSEVIEWIIDNPGYELEVCANPKCRRIFRLNPEYEYTDAWNLALYECDKCICDCVKGFSRKTITTCSQCGYDDCIICDRRCRCY